MFPVIEKIIKDGQFSGCNINIKTTPNNSLSAVFTFLLPVNASDIDLANSTKNKEQLDNIYALRSVLTRPLVVIDQGNGLDDAVDQSLSNISESIIAGAKMLSAIDMAGLIDNAAAKVSKPAKTDKQATAKTKQTKATQNELKSVTKAEPSPQVEEAQVAEHKWEKELDSL